MAFKITPTFFLLGLATLIWGSVNGLGSYLQNDFLRQQKTPQLDAQLATLASRVEANKGDFELRMRFAAALVEQGYAAHDSSFIMRALDQYKTVLDEKPEYPAALLGIARICVENGIVDKAIEFYQRYLKQQPHDKDARNGYSLALLQSGQIEQAKRFADALLQEDPAFMPAHVTLALIYRELGDTASAQKKLDEATELAPSAEVKTELARLRDSMTTTDATRASSNIDSQFVSPAMEVTSYFKNHPIVGPKIDRIDWATSDHVTISLRDFPVESMPSFAKEAFIRKTKERLAALPTPLKATIINERNEVLFDFDLGSADN